jgi:hypothetical protein
MPCATDVQRANNGTQGGANDAASTGLGRRRSCHLQTSTVVDVLVRMKERDLPPSYYYKDKNLVICLLC